MPDDAASRPEDREISFEELAATADQLHTENEHLRERIKDLMTIMESQMDALVEAEHECDRLREGASRSSRPWIRRLLGGSRSLWASTSLRRRRG